MNFKKFWPLFTVLVVSSLAIGALMVFGAGSGDAAAYFPLKPGSFWVYKVSMAGTKGSFSQKIKVSEPENGNPKVIAYGPDGNPAVFLNYVEDSQGLFKAKQMGPAGIFEYRPLWKVLSSKMNTGATWSWESDDHKMKETSKVLGNEKITVLAGPFETLVIECQGVNEEGKAYTEKTWYAKGVGYVKDEYTMDGKTLISELTEYTLAK
ncbi:MAG: hypothetical protein ACM3X9_00675 [Bacillota bacterium]